MTRVRIVEFVFGAMTVVAMAVGLGAEIGIAIERNQQAKIFAPISTSVPPVSDSPPTELHIQNLVEVRDKAVERLTISGDSRYLTIYGLDGNPVAVLDLTTGEAALFATPNEAARQYWKAVEILAPKCRADVLNFDSASLHLNKAGK